MLNKTQTLINAMNHLPQAGMLRLWDVSWEEYEDLLQAMEAKPGCRLSYNKGMLDIMGPRPDHERPKEFILLLASAMAEETDTSMEVFGSTTYRRQRDKKGVEPDTSFYVQHAAQLAGRLTLDLNTDPPPDVVVEIDTTHSSAGKLALYADLGVAEIWLYDGQRMTFFHLMDNVYTESTHSLAFPLLTAETFSHYLTLCMTQGQIQALRSFRQFVRTVIPPGECREI